MIAKTKILLAFLVIPGFFAARYCWLQNETINTPLKAASLQKTANYSETLETSHYITSSNATTEKTRHVADAVESLHVAYMDLFGDSLEINHQQKKLKLVLYKSRAEFKANNQSSSWAEAYYRKPACYAYYSEGFPNPYHWMIHEAVHQLNNETAHFRKYKWVDEGLATYFGTSKIHQQKLLPGNIDANTYPIWWLSSLSFTGDLQSDISKGRIIPLRALISGSGGPDINSNVNLYYIEYWSLSHFLFHFQDGRYAGKYKQLIIAGGTPENFEKIIGPIDQIQNEWYGYLQQKAAASQIPVDDESDADADVIFVQ